MGKLRPPLVMDQTSGEKKSGPYNDTGHDKTIEEDMICQINNTSLSVETKIEIMQ